MSERETFYLSADNVRAIYSMEVAPRITDPDARGLRSLSVLQTACAYPKTTVGGREVFATIYEKAAALYYAIDHAQAFKKGNKRTAYASLVYFLAGNGIRFEPDVYFAGALMAVALNIDYDAEDIKLFGEYVKKLCKRIVMFPY